VPTKKDTGRKTTVKRATAKRATAKRATAKRATAKRATAKRAVPRGSSQPRMTPARRAATPSGRTAVPVGRAPRPTMPAQPGDFIVIDSPQVGSLPREGEVLEVIQGEVSMSYRVRWADGHQTLITPMLGTARIVRASNRA